MIKISKIANQSQKGFLKSFRMKIDHRRKVHKKHLNNNNNNNMIIGTASHCAAAANLANSKGGGTDFSIAAIMARGGSSREPSERSISKWNFLFGIS